MSVPAEPTAPQEPGAPPSAAPVLSVVLAAGAMVCFLVAADQTGTAAILGTWLGALVCILLRLRCNPPGGLHPRLRTVHREAADCVAEVLILVGAGYSGAGDPGVVKLFHIIPMGWCCAVTALWTACIRMLGAALTGRHDSCGPVAVRLRMMILCVGILIEMQQHLFDHERFGILIALTIIFLGDLWTCWRRLAALGRELRDSDRGVG